MAIQTATPDQVASCVLALKAHVDRVEAENRRLRTERDQARAWAKAWKRAAKNFREGMLFWNRCARRNNGRASAKDAEIKRLREALDKVDGIVARYNREGGYYNLPARATCEVHALTSNALKVADHDTA